MAVDPPPLSPVHGWLILDKPIGLGSTQAVGAVKRLLREGGYGRAKVGHGGTLDPLASGVLPIAVGEATKLSGRMLDADKAYDFTITFGAETDTLDTEGQVVAQSDTRPTWAEVGAVLPRFTGPIVQRPPAFSALKIDGRRAYDLARAGEEVVLADRAVTIHAITMLPATEREAPRGPSGGVGSPPGTAFEERPVRQAAAGLPPRVGQGLEEITLSATVSKGTYIRSLARDIAQALGTVGHVTMLRRTKAGPFTLVQAITLDNLRQSATEMPLQALFLPLTAGLDDIPALPVSPEQAAALRQGRRLAGIAALPGLHLACLGPEPIALVEVGDDVKVVRGFNLMSKDET